MPVRRAQYSPAAVGTAESGMPFLTLSKGWLLLGVTCRVLVPSDSASTGTLTLGNTGPPDFTALSSLTPSADKYAPGVFAGDVAGLGGGDPNNYLASFVDSSPQLVTADQVVTIGWQPGATPGNTSPLVEIAIVFEDVIG